MVILIGYIEQKDLAIKYSFIRLEFFSGISGKFPLRTSSIIFAKTFPIGLSRCNSIFLSKFMFLSWKIGLISICVKVFFNLLRDFLL